MRLTASSLSVQTTSVKETTRNATRNAQRYTPPITKPISKYSCTTGQVQKLRLLSHSRSRRPNRRRHNRLRRWPKLDGRATKAAPRPQRRGKQAALLRSWRQPQRRSRPQRVLQLRRRRPSENTNLLRRYIDSLTVQSVPIYDRQRPDRHLRVRIDSGTFGDAFRDVQPTAG